MTDPEALLTIVDSDTEVDAQYLVEAVQYLTSTDCDYDPDAGSWSRFCADAYLYALSLAGNEAAVMEQVAERWESRNASGRIRLPTRGPDGAEVTSNGITIWCPVDDIDNHPTDGQGMVSLSNGDVLVAETDHLSEFAADVSDIQDAIRERERERNTPHPSLTVGERNPSL